MFIVLEGLNGAGKTTLSKALAAHLASPLLVRGSACTPFGRGLAALRERHQPGKVATLYTFAADLASLQEDVIAPALAKAGHVICDRWIWSTLAYQCIPLGMSSTECWSLVNTISGGRWPDVTLFLDVPPRVSYPRATHNDEEVANGGLALQVSIQANYRRLRDEFAGVTTWVDVPALPLATTADHCIEVVNAVKMQQDRTA